MTNHTTVVCTVMVIILAVSMNSAISFQLKKLNVNSNSRWTKYSKLYSSSDKNDKNDKTAKGVEEADAEKREMSSFMKDKIRRELVAGGSDPNVAAGNPILLIAGVIAVLVIAGGKDVFY